MNRLEISNWLELLSSHAELLVIVEAWPKLPDALRAGVIAMIQAANPGQQSEDSQ